jgi:hypothetical protein
MAYCLGLIGPHIRDDLDIVRGIRNDFAHGHREITFDEASIRDRCLNLSLEIPEDLWNSLLGMSKPKAKLDHVEDVVGFRWARVS